MIDKAKPLLVVSGFLGAGKTSFLRQILAALDRTKFYTDVILNDFANAEIDTATLQESSATTVSPIAAGCACCESLDELVALCEAAKRSTADLLILELNGTADPLALLESFTLLEERLPFFPRLQVCVIDARHWGRRNNFALLEQRQLETAGFWALTHSEKVSHSRLTEVRSSLAKNAPNSLETNALQILQTLTAHIEGSPNETGTKGKLTVSTGLLASDEFKTAGTPRTLSDAPHKLSHHFTGYNARLPLKVRTVSILRLLGRLPEWVLRAKALVKLVEQPGCRWLFERVGTEVVPHPMPIQNIHNSSSSMLCIGPRLDTRALDRLVAREFGKHAIPEATESTKTPIER